MTTYDDGLAVAKQLYSYLKTPFTFAQFLDALHRDSDGTIIPDSDYNSFIENLSVTKKSYTGIFWKSLADFNDVLKNIASKVPAGSLPTRRMVESAFINPKTFKPSLIDYAKMVGKISAQGVKNVGTTAMKTFEFVGETKYLLLLGALGIIGYKVLGAYNTTKSLTGSKK